MSEITRIPAPLYSPETKSENSLTTKQRENCATIANLITHCDETFLWAATAEGDVFWAGVRDRLLAIAKGEPLK